jgi:tryptophan halogenase
MKVEKIVIVGGGSAGWFSAALLSKWLPNIELSLVESENISTIGVGESTIGHINPFFNSLGMNTSGKEAWMKDCNAVYKASIKFTDFHQLGESFHYPFGSPDTSGTCFNLDDWQFKKYLSPDIPHSDFVDSFYPQMPFIYNNKPYFFDYTQLSQEHQQALDPWDPQRDFAYQLDATKLAHWMRDNICTNITHIKDDVVNVPLDEDGWIAGVETKNNGTLVADLYLDCTGFKSLLLGEALDVPYFDWSDDLPNNKAWATHKPYKDKEKEMELWTNCTALDNGWAWNIPLWDSIGTGYVFCDSFVNADTALAEFQKHIGHGDELEYKLMTIHNGRHKKAWVKNCLAIGLSNGFIEPLESSGLVMIHEALNSVIRILESKDGHINQYDRDSVSFAINQVVDPWKFFVSGHFYMSQRDDTEYWKWWTQKKEAGEHWWGIDLEHSEYWPSGVSNGRPIMNFTNAYDFGMEVAMSKGADSLYGLNSPHLCIAHGHHHSIFNDYSMNRLAFRRGGVMGDPINRFDKKPLADQIQKAIEYWRSRYVICEKIASEQPTMYEYLKKNIYEIKEEEK